MLQRIAWAAALAALGMGSANAATKIDVDNLVDGGGTAPAYGVGSSVVQTPSYSSWVTASQTWTVGISGKLEKIELYSSAVGNLSDGVTEVLDREFLVTLTILGGGTATSPGTVELGSVSMKAWDVGFPSKVSSFDFSPLGIRAAQGDILTFKMSVEACPEVVSCVRQWSSWHTMPAVSGSTNGYSGGAAFAETPDGLATYEYAYDQNFRTWMSAVPEPATWAMMISGFGLAGARLRRQRAILA